MKRISKIWRPSLALLLTWVLIAEQAGAQCYAMEGSVAHRARPSGTCLTNTFSSEAFSLASLEFLQPLEQTFLRVRIHQHRPLSNAAGLSKTTLTTALFGVISAGILALRFSPYFSPDVRAWSFHDRSILAASGFAALAWVRSWRGFWVKQRLLSMWETFLVFPGIVFVVSGAVNYFSAYTHWTLPGTLAAVAGYYLLTALIYIVVVFFLSPYAHLDTKVDNQINFLSQNGLLYARPSIAVNLDPVYKKWIPKYGARFFIDTARKNERFGGAIVQFGLPQFQNKIRSLDDLNAYTQTLEELSQLLGRFAVKAYKDILPGLAAQMPTPKDILRRDLWIKGINQKYDSINKRIQVATRERERLDKVPDSWDFKSKAGRALGAADVELSQLLEVRNALIRLGDQNVADIDRGLTYFRGDLTTSPIATPFRPSRREDVTFIPTMSASDQLYYALLGFLELSKGTGVYNILVAGASARMNPREAGKMKPIIDALLEKLYGSRIDLNSKAAVPLTEIDRVVYTFLGVFFRNVARVEEANQKWAGREAKPNRVRVLTIDEYVDELHRELSIQKNYGYSGEIREFRQPLGHPYYARPEDVKKAKGMDRIRAASAEIKSETVEKLLVHDPSAVIASGEKTPLGHGEFFHQLVVSNELLWDFEHDITWESVRNIDNTAGKFDWEWFVTLGLFIEKNLDFQGEVCPRVPGLKGGALIKTEEGGLWFTENPSFEATWQAAIKDFKKQDYRILEREEAEQYARSTFKDGRPLHLSAYRMDFSPVEAKRYTLDELVNEINPISSTGQEATPRIYLFKKHLSSDIKCVRRIFPEDTYWFNDAVGLFRPKFAYYLYRRNMQQTLDEFIQELRDAQNDKEAREAIAHRGRVRFPVLMDPKPAKLEAAVLMKIETNMWESTRVAGTQAHVDAVGVKSIANLDREAYSNMTDVEKMAAVVALRFLGVKEWDTPGAETYQKLISLIETVVRYVHEGDLLGHPIPSFQDAQVAIGARRSETGKTENHRLLSAA